MTEETGPQTFSTRLVTRAGEAVSEAGLAPGTQLNGTYEIDSLVAIGGMGEVYRGHVMATGDQVAIKVIRPAMVGNESALALFRKEASALHQLHHEAIIRYFVVATDPDLRRPYLAMEFVDGPALSDVLRGGPLPVEACLALLDRLAAGLAAAHAMGIIHRDISPDNIILPGHDIRRAKIIDFGIAKSTRPQAQTVIGDSFAGKYSYVSPEQLGLFGGEITARSDIYSLALVIAQASGGRQIDMGTNHAETIDRRRAVPALDAVAPALVPLLSAMLAPLPEARPASMEAVRAMARHIGAPTQEATPRRRGRLRAMEMEQEAQSPRPRRWLAAGAVAALMLGVAIPLAVFAPPGWRGGKTTPELDGDPYLPVPKTRPDSKTPLTLQPAERDLAEDEALPPAGSGSTIPPAKMPPEASRREEPRPQGLALPPPPVIGQAGLKPPPEVAMPKEPAGPQEAPANAHAAPLDAAQFVKNYPAPPCFFAALRTTRPGTADIEAFGASAAAAEAFDSAFTKAMGFDAQVQFRPLGAPQCPAVAFLRRVSGDGEAGTSLRFPTLNPRAGQALEATLVGAGFRAVSALLVSEDGVVESLPVKMTPGTRDATLALPGMKGSGTAGKLVIVVLAPQRPAALEGRARSFAGEVFPELGAELAKKPDGITILRHYLRVEG